MRYENAKNILPKDLLIELQKYAEGKILYVPSGDGKKEWGEVTGYRKRLQKRNQMICNKYKNGITVTELSEEYYLSIDSIKKIIYSKKKRDDCEFAPNVSSALAYDTAGMMEEWVHTYLQFSCNNSVISKQLLREQGILNGLVKLPLRLIHMESSSYSEEDVIDAKREVLQSTYDNAPPLLLLFEKGTFLLLEKEEVFHNLKRFRTNAWPVFIWMKKGADYELFRKHYGCVLRSLESDNNTRPSDR